MNETLIIEEPSANVMLLTLDRPAQRNAIDLALLDALSDAFQRFDSENRWRVAILTGTAPAFCAGLDLKTFSAPDAPRHRVTALIQSVPQLAKPIIAAVGGAAYTGGLELALGCDFILASEGRYPCPDRRAVRERHGIATPPCSGHPLCQTDDAEQPAD
ncbi:enoyl-CoA hydratase-related protein [Sphingobium aromaticiconvertens]|uniref:enoyl-CoA hydratase-related protein n=1 Tax=Sphingobium aromaticiconvertens TaxID=365341 RepID=UPI0030187450